MRKKNTSNKFNCYASFEDSIISLAKNELKQSSSNESEGHSATPKPKTGVSVGGAITGLALGGRHGAILGGLAAAITGPTIGVAAGAAVGGAIGYGLTESYYSDDLEKRYREYIKTNYESEFNQHKNDVPYIQSLISKAVKAVKELMNTSSSSTSQIMGAPVGIAVALMSDLDNNENNCE